MYSEEYCKHCNAVLMENARFCSDCGTEVSLRGKLSGIAKRLQYQAKSKFEEMKTSLDNQISDYLNKLENESEVRIGGVTISDNKREGVRSALQKFQNRYLEGDPTNELEYNQWKSELEGRIQERSCIVCFSGWESGEVQEIVVCPHCKSGGHYTHLKDWIKSKQFCPLCRETTQFNEFIKISI